MEDKQPNGVYAIGSPFGVTLVFANEQQLKGVIEHLQGMLEWACTNDIPSPYIYHIAHAHIATEEGEQWADWLKYIFAQGQDG